MAGSSSFSTGSLAASSRPHTGETGQGARAGARPRILFTTFNEVPSPSRIAQRLRERIGPIAAGCYVDLLCLRGNETAHVEAIRGQRIYRVPSNNTDPAELSEAFRRAVHRQIETGDYAVIHCCEPFGAVEAVRMQPHYGFRIVYEVDELPSWRYREQPGLLPRRLDQWLIDLRRLERTLLTRVDAVVCGSEAMRRLLETQGARPDRLEVISGGFLSRGTTRTPPAPTDSPPSELADDDTPLLLHAGAIDSRYDFDALLVAFARVTRIHRARLALVGAADPALLGELRELSAEMNLRGRVIVRDTSDDAEVARWVPRAQIGVIPWRNPDPRTYQAGVLPREAFAFMAASVPVIGSKCPALSEIFGAAGECATLVRAHDPDAWTAAIDRLLSDPDLRRRHAIAARARHGEQFSVEVGCIALERLYLRLIAEERPAAIRYTEMSTMMRSRRAGLADSAPPVQEPTAA